MSSETLDVFFYGLFMDAELLEAKGPVARPRPLFWSFAASRGLAYQLHGRSQRRAGGNCWRRLLVQKRMGTSYELDDGDRMTRGQALRLGVAVLAGPVLVLSMRKVDWQALEAYAGPLWLDAELLVVEAVHGYSLTLMVAASLCVHRLLSPERPVRSGVLLLPVLLWGFESAVSCYRALFSPGHWEPAYLLFLIWLIGIVTFLVLGLVFLLALPVAVRVEGGPRRRRVARIGLRSLAVAGVVVATVFLDWALVSTQVSELRILPALERAAAMEGD